MKYCIVNGDDFGASPGINRGILEAHERGILTSTSLMVNMPAAAEAAALARRHPRLSVGIHLNLTNEGEPVVDLDDASACREELDRQIEWFVQLIGALPTHLDTHHNIHRRSNLRQCFVDIAVKYGLPLREHSPVRYFSSFYGQWDGETHLEQISTEMLMRMLETEVGEGFTELSCHPGYVEPDFASCYAIEREAEVRTLCDPAVREHLEALGIKLIGFRDLPGILAGLHSTANPAAYLLPGHSSAAASAPGSEGRGEAA
jgi:predicted glycoside hydrolase/deacetylase ChbG (UPF0249 family)